MIDELTKHHSAYYIDHSRPPAPLLISSGFTDDLVPVDEAIRFYNRTRAEHQSTPISLFLGDFGHARAQSKSPDMMFRAKQRHHWFDYYLKGIGPAPHQGVQALTQTCGGPSQGGDRRLRRPECGSAVSLTHMGTNGARRSAPDRCLEPGDRALTQSTWSGRSSRPARARPRRPNQAGTATYRLEPAPTGGFTLMGAPTVVADISSADVELPGRGAIARRRSRHRRGDLGRARAVSAGRAPGAEATRQVFQLHANGWKFETGHVAKLELLPSDQPFARYSNGQGQVTVSNLELRLPVLEEPYSLAGLVQPPGVEGPAGGLRIAARLRGPGLPPPEDRVPVHGLACPGLPDLHRRQPAPRSTVAVRVVQPARACLSAADHRNAGRPTAPRLTSRAR